jgi:hypothetical protein
MSWDDWKHALVVSTCFGLFYGAGVYLILVCL